LIHIEIQAEKEEGFELLLAPTIYRSGYSKINRSLAPITSNLKHKVT
jgi:hypothetical protein